MVTGGDPAMPTRSDKATPVPVAGRIRWHAREYAGIKLIASAFCTFVADVMLCLVLSAITPFALLILVFAVPISTCFVGFKLAFFEQRLVRHVPLAMLSAISGIGALRLFVVNMSSDEIAIGVAILWPIMCILYMLGAILGGACSRQWYRIIVATDAAGPQKRGLCGVCAYDLRGSPSGICPECGATNPAPGTDGALVD